jgi:hypothetical protein
MIATKMATAMAKKTTAKKKIATTDYPAGWRNLPARTRSWPG